MSATVTTARGAARACKFRRLLTGVSGENLKTLLKLKDAQTPLLEHPVEHKN